jgi:hypothetical protein
VLDDKHVVLSYFTPNSSVYSITMGDKNDTISVKTRANDYECEYSGIFQTVAPLQYLNAGQDGRIRL